VYEATYTILATDAGGPKPTVIVGEKWNTFMFNTAIIITIIMAGSGGDRKGSLFISTNLNFVASF